MSRPSFGCHVQRDRASRVHRVSNGVETVGKQMPVQVERHCGRLVSEHLLNDLDVGSGGDRQRGRGVPERMRSETVETDRRGCLVEYCTLQGARL